MLAHLLIGLGLLSSSTPQSDAREFIRQALQCEANGRDLERRRFLDLAVKADPANSAARGLLGQLKIDGRWVDPGQAGPGRRDEQRAAIRARYEARRDATPDRSEAQFQLAAWCEEHGLSAEATAHLTRVTRLDPMNQAAWHKLGRRMYRGDWLTEEEIAERRAEAREQARADQDWLPLLRHWKSGLLDPARRDEATRELSQIRDPRAVPTVAQVFQGGGRWERWAVYILGRIDAPQAAQALAGLAVFGELDATRESAIRQLRDCDPRTYVGLLINWIKSPTRYEVEQPERDSEAVVLIDDPQVNIERRYHAVPVREDGRTPTLATANPRSFRAASFGRTEADPDVERGRAALKERVEADLREIDRANVPIERTNQRVLHALHQLTGKTLGPDQLVWTSWWTDQLGYHSSIPEHVSKPLVVQEVATPYVSPPPVIVPPAAFSSGHSCFAAGTPVHTRSGQRAIESLKIGDQVLAQDVATGELGFEPVIAVLRNPPSNMLRVDLESGESIVATEIHRFWLAGQGWKMTRELKPGDRLRVLGGTVAVLAVAREPQQRVYNLEVADKSDFFVGKRGVLVHDATLVFPARTLFDAPSAPR